MTLYVKALRTRLIISPMFLFAKTLRTVMTLWQRYAVRKYTSDAILFREIQCKKMENLMFKQRFQCELGWNKVKYARITITHVCFIALTLAGSLRWCLTLGLSASCSNSILGTRQMLMHEKECVVPILMYRLLIYHLYRRKQGGIVHCMRVTLFVVCDSVPSVCKLLSSVLFTCFHGFIYELKATIINLIL